MSYVVQSFSSPGEMDISAPGSAPLFSSFESSNGQLSQWKGVTSGCLKMLSMYMNVCIMATKHPTSVLGRNKKGLSQDRVTCFTSSCQVEI